jgi:hypothetical protein
MKSENDIHKRVRKLLKDYEGYVLVTCLPPTTEGNMQIEMSYEGDPMLACYLMEGAQGYLDEEDQQVDPKLEVL